MLHTTITLLINQGERKWISGEVKNRKAIRTISPEVCAATQFTEDL